MPAKGLGCRNRESLTGQFMFELRSSIANQTLFRMPWTFANSGLSAICFGHILKIRRSFRAQLSSQLMPSRE